jgi:hypothetical protein
MEIDSSRCTPTSQEPSRRGVRIEMAGIDAVSLRLDEGQPVKALSRLASRLCSLEGMVAMALLGCESSEGDFSERRVREVDEHARRVLVCVEPYEG